MAAVPTERWSDRTYAPLDRATRSWDIAGAASEDDAYKALGAIGIAPGARHPMDPTMAIPIGGLEVVQVSPAGLYRGTANYKYGTFTGEQNPLLQPPMYQWLPSSVTEPSPYDINGNLITNSVGDPPSQMPTRLARRLAIVISRNEKSFPIDVFNQYVDAVNSDTFMVAGKVVQPGQACFKSIVQTQKVFYNAIYVPIEYHIDFHPGYQQDKNTKLWDGFLCRFADKGKRAWFSSAVGGGAPTTKLDHICLKGASGAAKVTTDVFLNGQGGVFSTSAGYTDTTGTGTVVNNPATIAGMNYSTDQSGAAILTWQNRRTAVFQKLGIFY